MLTACSTRDSGKITSAAVIPTRHQAIFNFSIGFSALYGYARSSVDFIPLTKMDINKHCSVALDTYRWFGTDAMSPFS